MIKYLTKRDIVDMLRITVAQFRYSIKKIGIKPIVESSLKVFYTIQDMIDIYKFMFRKYHVLESKINYKEIVL